VARFRVTLAPAARRQLDAIRGAAFLALRGVILALAEDPRPLGSGKLAGRDDLWRVRVRVDGEPWRIVYQIDAKAGVVVVTRVVRRNETTYRGMRARPFGVQPAVPPQRLGQTRR
jgi:mRNA-degrading endonuclease RelE of RelBE toxin-antitoxin system